jgi:hypothetical protein
MTISKETQTTLVKYHKLREQITIPEVLCQGTRIQLTPWATLRTSIQQAPPSVMVFGSLLGHNMLNEGPRGRVQRLDVRRNYTPQTQRETLAIRENWHLQQLENANETATKLCWRSNLRTLSVWDGKVVTTNTYITIKKNTVRSTLA